MSQNRFSELASTIMQNVTNAIHNGYDMELVHKNTAELIQNFAVDVARELKAGSNGGMDVILERLNQRSPEQIAASPERLSQIWNSPESKAHRAAMGLDDDLNEVQP